jgi:hypothetical protein
MGKRKLIDTLMVLWEVFTMLLAIFYFLTIYELKILAYRIVDFMNKK